MPRGLPDSWTYTIGRKILRRARNMGRTSSPRRSMILGFKLSKIVIYKEQTFRILNTPNGKLWWHCIGVEKLLLEVQSVK